MEKFELIELNASNIATDGHHAGAVFPPIVLDLIKNAADNDSINVGLHDGVVGFVVTDSGHLIYIDDYYKNFLSSVDVDHVAVADAIVGKGAGEIMDTFMIKMLATKIDGVYYYEVCLVYSYTLKDKLFDVDAKDYQVRYRNFCKLDTDLSKVAPPPPMPIAGLGAPPKKLLDETKLEFEEATDLQADPGKLLELQTLEETYMRRYVAYINNQEKQREARAGKDFINTLNLVKRFVQGFTPAERQALLFFENAYKGFNMTLVGDPDFDAVFLDPKTLEAEAEDVAAQIVRDPVISKLPAAADGRQAVLALETKPLGSQPRAYILMNRYAVKMPYASRYLFVPGGRNMLREGLAQERIYHQVVSMSMREADKVYVSRNRWVAAIIDSGAYDYALANVTKLRETPGNAHINRFQFNTVEAMRDSVLRTEIGKIEIPKAAFGSMLGSNQPPIVHLCCQLMSKPFANKMTSMYSKIWSKKLKTYDVTIYANYKLQCTNLMSIYDKEAWGMRTSKARIVGLEELYDIYKKHLRDYNTGVFNDSSKYYESTYHNGFLPNNKTFVQMYIETNFFGWVAHTFCAADFALTTCNGSCDGLARPLYHEGDDATFTVKDSAFRPKAGNLERLAEPPKQVWIDFRATTVMIESGGSTEQERYGSSKPNKLKHYVEDEMEGQGRRVVESIRQARAKLCKVWIGLVDLITILKLMQTFKVRMIFPPLSPYRSLLVVVLDLDTSGSFAVHSEVTVSHLMVMLNYLVGSIVYAGHEYVTMFYTTRMEFSEQINRWSQFEALCGLHWHALKDNLDYVRKSFKFNFDEISALKRSEGSKVPMLQHNLEENETKMRRIMLAGMAGEDTDTAQTELMSKHLAFSMDLF